MHSANNDKADFVQGFKNPSPQWGLNGKWGGPAERFSAYDENSSSRRGRHGARTDVPPTVSGRSRAGRVPLSSG